MGFNELYFRDSDEELIRQALASDHPYLQDIPFERLLEEGWAPLNVPEIWTPFAAGGFPTPSGKCEFYSASLASRGIDPLPVYVSAASVSRQAAHYPLRLITSKPALHFLNSSYANLPRHLHAEREPRLEMHPNDAAPRGIEDRDLVCISNERGTVQMPVQVGDRVRPGVVAMPSWWWASLSPGGSSANALTADGLTDWEGGGAFHDTLVEVMRLE